MSAANYLVRWMPDIVEATADDIARFGPNAAQVRTMLKFIPTMGNHAMQASDAAWNDVFKNLNDQYMDARNAVRDALRSQARRREVDNAGRDAWYKASPDRAPRTVGRDIVEDAARGEVVSDLITPEQYRLLTNPLNAGRTLQERMGLMLPDQQGSFIRMINQLRPASVEDILAVEQLTGNPNVDALLEMLTSPQMAPGQPLARRIKAAETMYRIGRDGKRGIV